MDEVIKQNDSEKPKRLYFKSYIQLINNSIGSNMFRNFYVETKEDGEFDALDDGQNSCAFYVSAVLVILKKLGGMHGTVESTINDLIKSGWQEVEDANPGDVLVWEAQEFDDGVKRHIGFSVGNKRAVSTSWTELKPVEHDQTFDGSRKIEQIFRMQNWDSAEAT